MADLSRVTYTAGAGQTDFAITFDYQVESHLAVNVDGVDTPFTVVGTDAVIAAAAGGEEVEIYRDTSIAARVVDFTSGGSVTEKNLDDSADQAVKLVQEAWDRLNKKLGTVSVLDLKWDAESQRMVNLTDPTGAQDAATKAYIDAINAALDARLLIVEDFDPATGLPGVTAADIYDVMQVDASGNWVKADSTRDDNIPNAVVRTQVGGTISPNLIPSVASGLDAAANVGSGVGFWRDIVATTLNFRSLISNTTDALTVTLDGDEVDLAIIFNDGAAGAATDLWSSQKIETELATKAASVHTHAMVDATDHPGTVTEDNILIGNASSGYDEHEVVPFDIVAAAADRKGSIIYFDDNGDGTTLPAGAAGSTLQLNSGTDPLPVWSVLPIESPIAGPSLGRLEVATEFQDDTSASGWYLKPTEIGQAWDWQLISGGFLQPGALKNGGSVRVFATGEYTPGSSNPGLGLRLDFDSTPLLPTDPVGSEGWLMDRSTLGAGIMERIPVLSRWWLDVTVHSLGQYAAASGSRGGGNATLFTEGKLTIGKLQTGGGGATQFYPAGGAIDHVGWASATAYTIGDRVWSHGAEYEAIGSHTSVLGDAPGGGLTWRHRWRPLTIVYNIAQTNDLSAFDAWTDDQGDALELYATGARQDVTTAAAAHRATGAAYTLGERILGSDANTYVCVQVYDPDTGSFGVDNKPVTGADWDEYWVLEDQTYSEVQIDCVEMTQLHGLAGYEPVLR